MRTWYKEWQPLFLVVLQRFQTQLNTAAEQYAAHLDLQAASVGASDDIGLGRDVTLPCLLKPIGIESYAEIQQFAGAAMRKLTQLDFAKLSMIELWFCNAAWGQPAIPAEAVEVLTHWRNAMFASLLSLYTTPPAVPRLQGHWQCGVHFPVKHICRSFMPRSICYGVHVLRYVPAGC